MVSALVMQLIQSCAKVNTKEIPPTAYEGAIVCAKGLINSFMAK